MAIIYTRRNLLFANNGGSDLAPAEEDETITLDVRQFDLIIEALRNVV
jgi:hypothetical protein